MQLIILTHILLARVKLSKLPLQEAPRFSFYWYQTPYEARAVALEGGVAQSLHTMSGEMVVGQLYPKKLSLFKFYAARAPCTSRATSNATGLVFLFPTRQMPRGALSHQQVRGR